LALVRAELAALLQVGLERRIRHQRVALFLAIGLARVLPDVHHLVERPDLGGRVKDRLAAVLHLRRMAVLLVELEPGAELVVVQRALIAEQASQCAFCSSGVAVSAAALLSTNPNPSEKQIREALDKNLCRCGSHNRMVRAVLRAAREMA